MPIEFLKALLRRQRVACYPTLAAELRGARGLEVGGPSQVFHRHGLVPLYALAGSIDNVNFSRTTVWEGTIREGHTFAYDRAHAPGRQFILEAADLAPIRDGSYDFVLSSHTIEHVANPLRALAEWMRVLRPGGLLVLAVPHHAETFDHRRAVTTLAHLIDDYRHGTAEDDLTHLPEILELHDLALDPPAGDAAEFRARSERNQENRCLHHHVFDEGLVTAMLEEAGFQLLAVERQPPNHIIAAARSESGPPQHRVGLP